MPWKSKPSESVVQAIRGLSRRMIMLVQRPGPTCFVLQEGSESEGNEVKTKVLIGSKVTCSTCKNCTEACSHTLFVMLRVLGVPPSNPLVWQTSLLDCELDELIQCGNRLARKRKPGTKKDVAESRKQSRGGVQPRELDPDERCPICFETLSEARDQELLSCGSCGNHIHGRCIYVWARHQESLDRKVTCPLCRGDWGEVKWSRSYACEKRGAPVQVSARERNKDTFYGSSCGKCSKAPLQGKRYTCVICRHFDLCEECFQSGVHSQHPFVVQCQPDAEPESAPRGETDLENFEFKPSTSASSGKKAKAPARPLKERTREENVASNQQTPSAESRQSLRRQSEEATKDLSVLSIEPVGLSLMAVGTSVKSGPVGAGAKTIFPCSHGSVLRSSGRLSHSTRRRTSSFSARGRRDLGATLPAKSSEKDPGPLGAGLGLGVQALGINGSGLN